MADPTHPPPSTGRLMAASRTRERPLVVALASLPPGDPGPLLAGAFRAGAGEVRAPRPAPATLRALGALEERGAIEVRSNGFPGGEVVIVPGPGRTV